jgi:hypothetical protein
MATKLKTASIAMRQNAKRDHSPKWEDTEALTSEQFTRKFRQAMDWYRLESSGKELKPKVIDWMGRNGYDKATIQSFKKTKDNRCSPTVGAIAACLIKGMPEQRAGFNQDRNTAEWLKAEIAAIIVEGKNDKDDDEVVVEVKPVVAQPSIQDRIREQAGQMSEEIDGAIDNFIMDPEGFNPKEFKMVSLLRGKGAKAAQARFIKQIFQKGYNELTELITNPDDQLREAYRHLPRKHIKKIYEFYESIFQACDQIAAEAKVMKKVRAKKVKPAEELVKKIKYKLTDDKLGIASVPAAGIIGASAVVVFNTKNRKIGIYQATSSSGLNVKGASIVDFTAKSFQKTLRKPDVQLKEFKEQNTQKRVETWFDKIKATDTVLNGRINGEVMILKIFK